MSDPALGLSAPHHSTLLQSLPGPCLGPSRPTLPSPDLVPASAPQGGTPQVRHSVSFQLLQCTPSPLWLPGSCLLPGGCPPPPGPVQAAVRWLCGEPTLAGLVPALPFTWAGFLAPPLPSWAASPPWASVSSFVQWGNQAALRDLPPSRSHSLMPGVRGGSACDFHPQVRARQCPVLGEPHAYVPLEPRLLPPWVEGHHKLYPDS